LGYSSFGLAIENGHLDDLRIVADVYQDGGADHFSTRLMVRKNSGINAIEDLKGKVLAANGPGSGGDMAIRQMLRVHHLEEKKDYTLISGPPLNQFPMLNERKADLVTISVPQAYDRGGRQDTLQRQGRPGHDAVVALRDAQRLHRQKSGTAR
jgi:sulfonate transport system substrate-binding protein